MLHHTRVLLDSAIALERAGEWGEALGLAETAFARSVRNREIVSLLEAIFRMGFIYRGMGDTELAIDHLNLAIEVGEATDNLRIASRALNVIAIMHQEHGRLHQAEESYQRAQVLAESAGDTLTAGNIAQNLGLLAFVRGKPNTAIAQYQNGLEKYQSIEYERGVAGILNNLGMLYIDLNRLDEAEESLDQALTISRTIGDRVNEAIVNTNLTELWIARKDAARARETCDQAFEFASTFGDAQVRCDCLRLYGLIYRQSNKPHLAEVHLMEAISSAREEDLPLQEAEAQRELSLVFRAQERNREALQALNRAHNLFSSLQAHHRTADIDARLDRLEEDFLSLVHAWGESIEAKDRYTAGHCQRVADYACRIAEIAGMPERDLVWFRMGAFLHDVGKTETPEEILNKPGKLTEEELKIMQRHTVAGDELLSNIEFPYEIRPMVRSHHERWEGGGYPDGLVGEAIPWTARILRLADVFDALTTNRSYRNPMPPERALEIMEVEEGDSFDPELFAIFKDLFPTFAEEVRALHAREAAKKRDASDDANRSVIRVKNVGAEIKTN